jgi:hypothetical protein
LIDIEEGTSEDAALAPSSSEGALGLQTGGEGAAAAGAKEKKKKKPRFAVESEMSGDEGPAPEGGKSFDGSASGAGNGFSGTTSGGKRTKAE